MLPTRRIVALADAGPGVGLGHVARSSAVVSALRAKGIRCTCLGIGSESAVIFDGVEWAPGGEDLLPEPPQARAVMLDTYRVSPAGIHATTSPIVWFHDQGDAPENAALVIAPADDRVRVPRWLTGLRYACLRPSFWGSTGAEVRQTVRRILILTGAGSPGEAARVMACAAVEAAPRAEVRWVRGPQAGPLGHAGILEVRAPTDLRSELAEADLVISLAGQTSLEAACLGVPMIVVAAVGNQRGNAALLGRLGAAVVCELDADRLKAAIQALENDAPSRRHLARNARQAVDGYGALRVAAQIEQLVDSGPAIG